jgi:hypothetical protein
MSFLDGEVPALLGEPLDALLFTCVGVPEYASAAGGLPVRRPPSAWWRRAWRIRRSWGLG